MGSEIEELQKKYEQKIKELHVKEKDPDKLSAKIQTALEEHLAKVNELTQIMNSRVDANSLENKKRIVKKPDLTKPVSKFSSEPVKHIGFYVEPYYRAPLSPGLQPQKVNVHKEFNSLLSSKDEKVILKVRDKIKASNATVTPMTLFVLAARLFDVGQKEDAAFWFYAAKDRCILTKEIGDIRQIQTVINACDSFINLMGPTINGSIFCDIDKQVDTLLRSAEWTKRNPYDALLDPNILSPHKDREKVLKEVIKERLKQANDNKVYFSDPKNRKAFKAERKKFGADKKFCS